MKLIHEQIDRLREEFPEAYEERLELVNLSARLWNCLCWYGSDSKKFRGRLVGLAITLRDQAHAERGPDRTVMDSVVERMTRDGYINCETRR